MTIPRGRVFATDGGARWGVCNTPLHGYPHQQTNGAQPPTNQHQTGPRARMTVTMHVPRWHIHPLRDVWWGVCNTPLPCRQEGLRVPGKLRRRPQTPPANLAGVPDASESVKQVVSRFPTPRKVSNKLFQGFRRVGKAQTSCFKESEASERLKQVVSRNPRPRKGPNKLFQSFRRLGASTDAGEAGRVPDKLRRCPQTPPKRIFTNRIKNYHS